MSKWEFVKRYPLPVMALTALVVGVFFELQAWTNIRELIFVIAIVVGGLPKAFDIVTSIREKSFGIDLIALIGIFGALVVGEYTAGVVLVLMLTGGEALEDYAEGKAKSTLTTLLSLSPKIAHLKTDKGIQDKKVEELKVDDIVMVKHSEVIPIDGVVVSGEGMIDESSLTGESLPVVKKIGDEVLSGTVLLSGTVDVRVTKLFEDSSFSQIIKLVQHAEENRAPLVKMAARYGAIFTPIVLVFSAIVYGLTQDLRVTYAVFAIASPCPLLIAAPVAMVAGIARAAKAGIVMKSGTVLERLASVTSLVFDKTGTLTKGDLELVECKIIDPGVSEEKAIEIASALSMYSSHIIANAVTEDRQVKDLHVKDFHEEIGKGLSGKIEEGKVLFGSLDFMKSHGVDVGEEGKMYHDKSRKESKIISFLAINNKVVAILAFRDVVREDAGELIQDLKKLRLNRLTLATGDHKLVAAKIAAEVGIEDVKAELSPADKVEVVKSNLDAGEKVAMVGDGVNDAAAMKLATVGIAMGVRGNTVAYESADAVVLVNSVSKVADAINISRKAVVIARQSIIYGMGLTFIGMILAGAGILSPVWAAIGQEIIDLFAILWALRVLKIN